MRKSVTDAAAEFRFETISSGPHNDVPMIAAVNGHVRLHSEYILSCEIVLASSRTMRSIRVRCSASRPWCPLRVCAVQRRRFPVGANPTRQSLQPEAIGAVMEVTKWLKPSISVSRIGDSASVQAATRVNAE
jgi:hypothetical protein